MCAAYQVAFFVAFTFFDASFGHCYIRSEYINDHVQLLLRLLSRWFIISVIYIQLIVNLTFSFIVTLIALLATPTSSPRRRQLCRRVWTKLDVACRLQIEVSQPVYTPRLVVFFFSAALVDF